MVGMHARRPNAGALPSLLVLLACAAGCQSYDEARVLQALNQRGFGRKYAGDSNEVLTIGIRDSFSVFDRTNPELNREYTVRMDGVITAEYVGEVYVAGYTTDEIAQVLNQRYREYYNDVDVSIRPGSLQSKRYWMHGEIAAGERTFQGDTTVWDAVMRGTIPPTADIGDIYVLRSDPRHPLMIPIDLDKMLKYGDSTDNVLLREDDIVVVRPNFFGILRRFVELIISPLQPVTQLTSGLRNIQTNVDSLTGNQQFGYGGGYGGGFYGGGGYSGNNQAFGQVSPGSAP